MLTGGQSWATESLGGSPGHPPVRTSVRGHGITTEHSGIGEESILLTVGRPASYDAGIRGKPLGGFPPNPLSLVLTEGVRGSHRVAPMMSKGEAFRTAFPNFSS